MEMKDIHAKVFDILHARHKEDDSFRFSLRRTNRFGRLSKGYWFHGNDDYLAVSFWSGMDWMNKTPNIFFVVHSDGTTKMEISVADSDLKFEYIRSTILPSLKNVHGIELNGEVLKTQYHYQGNDFEASLLRFLANEKVTLDRTIEYNSNFFASISDYNSIGFIPSQAFERHLANVLRYREKRESVSEIVRIAKISIKNFGDIRESPVLMDIPQGTKWLFLTGENGVGKSTILRAITVALLPDATEHLRMDEPGHYAIEIDLNFRIAKNVRVTKSAQNPPKNGKPHSIGFCAYGSSRQMTTVANSIEENIGRRVSADYSIFHPDGILLDLDTNIRTLAGENAMQKERLELIEDLLTDKELIPQLARVLFKDDKYYYETEYVEKDSLGKHYPPVRFKQLASGVRSMVAFMGDMLIRLLNQQPNVADPSELCGIVLIDEIDIHLHPAMQKKIVKILSNTFPNLQFIVTTHSPITLLGAPPESVFFRVFREKSKGVTVEKMDIDVANLTPNLILTSPIFGMSEVLSTQLESDKNFESLRTEDSFAEMNVRDRSLESLVKKYLSRIQKNEP